jgi:hypothetical protein
MKTVIRHIAGGWVMAIWRLARRCAARATVSTAALALGLAAAAAARAQLILSIPANLSAHPGDTISVPVNLTVGDNRLDSAHGQGIATVGFVINYDPSLGTVPGSAIALGSLLDPGGNPYGFPPYGGNAIDTAGQVRTFTTSGTGTPGLPAGTSGPLALISFTVPANAAPNTYALTLGASTATVVTDNAFTDYTAGSRLTLSDGSLTVTPVPEPTSLLLAGLAATAFATSVRARRRSRIVGSL